MLNYETIQQLEHEAGSPFYLCDQQLFESNCDRINKAFRSRWDPFILAYSYKTNYTPWLCGVIRDRGGWAEVVSRMEYDLALRIGQDPRKIIFNGPVKRPDDIAKALDGGSWINLDSTYELEAITAWARAHPEQTANIGLRINIGLADENGISAVQQNLPVSRFGLCPYGDDLGRIKTALAAYPNVQVLSVHGHTSTIDRALWCYEQIAGTLVRIARTHFPETIRFINVGGGIYGDFPPEMKRTDIPTFDDYARRITGVLLHDSWCKAHRPTLVLEPGMAMVANAVSFITRVVSLKDIRGQTLVTVDGSAMHAKPTLHSWPLPFRIISRQAPPAAQSLFSVAGSTCMEKDYLLRDVQAPLPAVGDFIQIRQVGAYTIVLSPPFINYAPAIVSQCGDQFTVVRTAQKLDGLLTDYRLPN